MKRITRKDGEAERGRESGGADEDRISEAGVPWNISRFGFDGCLV